MSISSFKRASNVPSLCAAKDGSVDSGHLRGRLEIASFFRGHREHSGIAVADLARALEVSEQTLSDYELGLQAIPMDDIFVLTNLLNIPPEEVMKLIHSALGS